MLTAALSFALFAWFAFNHDCPYIGWSSLIASVAICLAHL